MFTRLNGLRGAAEGWNNFFQRDLGFQPRSRPSFISTFSKKDHPFLNKMKQPSFIPRAIELV